jgi:hypothetical protein
LYFSKSRWKWREWEYVSKHAPSGWKEQNGIEIQDEENETPDHDKSATKKSTDFKHPKSTWARLIAKIYEVDPLVCPKCGSEMKILAVIMDSYEINKILQHLVKTNKAPPGVEESDSMSERVLFDK